MTNKCFCGKKIFKVILGIGLCENHLQVKIPQSIQDNWTAVNSVMRNLSEPISYSSRYDDICTACGSIILKGEPVKMVLGIIIHYHPIWCWYRGVINERRSEEAKIRLRLF